MSLWLETLNDFVSSWPETQALNLDFMRPTKWTLGLFFDLGYAGAMPGYAQGLFVVAASDFQFGLARAGLAEPCLGQLDWPGLAGAGLLTAGLGLVVPGLGRPVWLGLAGLAWGGCSLLARGITIFLRSSCREPCESPVGNHLKPSRTDDYS